MSQNQVIPKKGIRLYIQKIADSMDSIYDQIVTSISSAILNIGEISVFAISSLKLLFTKPYRYNEVIKHMEFIGNQSVGII